MKFHEISEACSCRDFNSVAEISDLSCEFSEPYEPDRPVVRGLSQRHGRGERVEEEAGARRDLRRGGV